MSWRVVTIDEIATVKGGKRLPKGHDFVDFASEHLYIRARDIGCGRIEMRESVYLDENTFQKISKYIVSEGDVVVTIVGANIGDVGYVTSQYAGANLTENAAKIVVDREICNPLFLKYCLANKHAKKRFQFIASGAAQGKLGLFKIKSYDFSLPTLKVQEKISAVLATYDDLIGNNRRRIQLLEEAARLLYKEWFVHLRFPGYGHLKVVDGVPEGWRRKSLGDCVTLNYGKALKADNRIHGAFPVYGSSGVVGFHNTALVDGPAIVLGRKGNVGSVFWEQHDSWPIDTVYFVSAEQSNLYLYYVLKNMTFSSNDVAVPGLNRKFAYSRSVLEPTEKVKNDFIQEVDVLKLQIDKLTAYNQKLAEARDLLLPRLMNGELEV